MKFLLLLAVIFAFFAQPTFAKSIPLSAPAKGASAKVRKPASAPATEADVKAKAATFNLCNEGEEPTIEKVVWVFNYSYEKPTEPKHTATYYIATCLAGAYNQNSILFSDDEYSGLQAIPLVTPVTYGKKMAIVGWSADIVGAGLSYDKKHDVLTSFSKGRGVGDMSSSGTYKFIEGQIVLRKYDLDESADGKFNPRTVWASGAPAKR